jgi:hypothetical protein
MKIYLNPPPLLALLRQVHRANQEAELGIFDAWESKYYQEAWQLQQRRRVDKAVKYVTKDR